MVWANGITTRIGLTNKRVVIKHDSSDVSRNGIVEFNVPLGTLQVILETVFRVT